MCYRKQLIGAEHQLQNQTRSLPCCLEPTGSQRSLWQISWKPEDIQGRLASPKSLSSLCEALKRFQGHSQGQGCDVDLKLTGCLTIG
jgi:hypothetical protein